MPKPNESFLENAWLLREVIDHKKSGRMPGERSRLERLLSNKFAGAFGLSPDSRKTSYRFFHNFLNTDLAPKSKLFDHPGFFRRGNNLVIASQPYGIEEEELKRWAADSGAFHTIASEWGYYNPGRASLFFVEFTPQAKQNFEKRLNASRRFQGLTV